MFIFKKTPDSENPYSVASVTIELPDSLTLFELREAFDDFCKACGYVWKEEED